MSGTNRRVTRPMVCAKHGTRQPRKILALLLVILTLFSTAAPVTVTAAAAKGSYVNVTSCYSTLNKYRKSARKKTLSRNTVLENAAKTRAKEIVKKFSHTRPNGRSGLSIIKGNVYKGENIAMGQKTCAAVMRAWYNSSGHRQNMLNKYYRKAGIAGYKYKGRMYWVQLFSS